MPWSDISEIVWVIPLPIPEKGVVNIGGSGLRGSKVHPDLAGSAGSGIANAKPRQLIDNVVENPCAYCKSFMIPSHPILAVLILFSQFYFEHTWGK